MPEQKRERSKNVRVYADDGSISAKRCCDCKETKAIELFDKNRATKDGYASSCKVCMSKRKSSEKTKQRQKESRLVNIEKFKEKGKKYYEKHRERIIKRNMEYARRNRAVVRARQLKREVERKKEDAGFHIMFNLRRRQAIAFKKGIPSSTTKLLGCSIGYLRQHLSSKFRDGMSFENYGKVWELDHIRPLTSFDLTDPEQLAVACHYTKLQPLLIHENRVKSNKWSEKSVSDVE